MRKKIFFYLLCISFIVCYTFIYFKLDEESKISKYKQAIQKNIQENSNTVIVNQDNIRVDDQFKASIVHFENLPSYVLLEWSIRDTNVNKIEIYHNQKLVTTLASNQTQFKMNIIDYDFQLADNEFTLKIHNNQGETKDSKIMLNMDYVFDLTTKMTKVNDDTLLELSYYTFSQSPVNTPILSSTSNVTISAPQNIAYNDVKVYRKNTMYYRITLKDHDLTVLNTQWSFSSIGMQFERDIKILK